MKIFADDEDAFEDGRWTGELSHRLAVKNLVRGWTPRPRVRRNTWHQWIQYEPAGWNLPFFWSGKPSVQSNREYLCAGYYVERGLPRDAGATAPEIIGAGWHWHRFYRCLIDGALADELNEMMLTLPPDRRCVWIGSGSPGQSPWTCNCFPYRGRTTLADTKLQVDGIQATKWINVVLGVRYSRAECLKLQDKIVDALRTPIVRGNDIYRLVEAVVV